jgi:hypothetical protein
MKLSTILKFALATIVLVPTSCVPGHFAIERMAIRTDGHLNYIEPLWIENCLWLLAIGLIVFWSWLGNRILKNDKS